MLRDPQVHELRLGADPVVTTPDMRQFQPGGQPLIITKSSIRSRVHRRAPLDYIGVKIHDGEGKLTGELRIIGLFTATAYTHSVMQIPYLRNKAEAVLVWAGFDLDTHSGKALATVLETYPRDELFQIDADTLQAYAVVILSLYDRRVCGCCRAPIRSTASFRCWSMCRASASMRRCARAWGLISARCSVARWRRWSPPSSPTCR